MLGAVLILSSVIFLVFSPVSTSGFGTFKDWPQKTSLPLLGDNEAATAAATAGAAAAGWQRRKDMSRPGASFVVKLISIHGIVCTKGLSGGGGIQFLLNHI